MIPFPGGTSGKEPACQCRRHRRRGFSPWVRKIPWGRAWQPIPVSLPGESHGQRSLRSTDHGVAKSGTRLKQLSIHTDSNTIILGMILFCSYWLIFLSPGYWLFSCVYACFRIFYIVDYSLLLPLDPVFLFFFSYTMIPYGTFQWDCSTFQGV